MLDYLTLFRSRDHYTGSFMIDFGYLTSTNILLFFFSNFHQDSLPYIFLCMFSYFSKYILFKFTKYWHIYSHWMLYSNSRHKWTRRVWASTYTCATVVTWSWWYAAEIILILSTLQSALCSCYVTLNMQKPHCGY